MVFGKNARRLCRMSPRVVRRLNPLSFAKN